MAYNVCIGQCSDSCVQVNTVTDDFVFAQVIADALRTHSLLPSHVPQLNNALQGNLCEFCVWDIGDRLWQIYSRTNAWPSNADSPWRPASDPGVDILALVETDDSPKLIVIEVKSSQNNGTNLISGNGSTLQSDFRHLYEGDVQNRLLARVGEIIFDLRIRRTQHELARKLLSLVGDSPAESPQVKLIGVLLCNRDNDQSYQRRISAFEELQSYLHTCGWCDEQLEFRCIEVNNFSQWIVEIMQRSINGSAHT